MQKSAVVCLAISILASVSYAADSNTTTEGAYNLIFNSSVNNKINGHDNVVGGNYNEVNDEFLDIAIANKTKNEEEIKKAISDKLVKEYKEVLAIVKANKAKSDGEILNAIKESKGIKSYEIVKYNFSLINGIIKNVKEGKLTKDEDILYKAFDPYDIYNKNVIKKVIEKKDKDDKEIKTDLVKSGNYFNNTLLGYSNKAKNSMRSVVIGDGAEVENSNSDGNVAIGNSAKAKGQAATAVGPRSSALNDTTTALGYGTMSLGKGSTTVGSNATAYGTYGLALGTNSKVIGEQGTALGYSAEVFGEGSVALGSSSRADKASDKDGYRPYSAIDGKYKGITREKLREIAIASKGDRTKVAEAVNAMINDRVWKANLGVVSIGDANMGTRQIANVAAGYYDTDAVNVAQLKELKTYVDNSTPFEYATLDNKSLRKYNNKYYTEDNKEYTGEVKIKAKELFKLSNIKSSLNDKNTSETTTPSENSSDKNDVLVVEDLDSIKKDIKELKDLKDKFNNVSEKSNLAVSGVSNAVAMANLPQVNEESKYNLSAAYGYYGSSHSIAVGFSGTNNKRNVVYKLSGSVNSFGHVAVGLGVGVAIKRYDKSIENLSKVEKEFKEYKEQSERQIKEYKERLERLEKALLKLKK